MNASETRRRAPHVHQWLVYFWPVGFLSLLLFAPDDLHGATFRRSTPSCGLNLNMKNFSLGVWECHTFPGFLPALLIKVSNDCVVLCSQAKRAVQRGATAVIFDVSENPDAIDQVCAPGSTHSRYNDTVCEWRAVSLFWRKLSSVPCPPDWQCVLFVQTMIFLSLVLFRSMRISPAHWTILGLWARWLVFGGVKFLLRELKMDIKVQLSLDHDQNLSS